MDITIVIDKSTFQLLGFNELSKLGSYYRHNVTPILVREILGDLKKETGEGKRPSEEVVKDFSFKLFPIENAINAHYEKIVREDLISGKVMPDGRQFVGIEKIVKNQDGKKGMIVETTDDERLIYNWKQGKFSEEDKAFSALWRVSTTQADILLNLQKAIREKAGELKLNSFGELNELAEKKLNENSNQHSLLVFLLEHYSKDAAVGLHVLRRWMVAGKPPLKLFAPYAYHCAKVDMLFNLGLQSGLIGTKPTNRVDMEYFYYIPFCNVFTSNDKVHKNLVNCLLKPEQKFVTGEELKKDLNEIVKNIEAGGEEAKKKYFRVPPVNEESLTFKLWKEYYGYPEKQQWNRNLSEKEMDEMKKKMDEFINASKGEAVIMEDGEDTNFIMRTSYMTKDDLCYCGSGKRVIDCCIPEDKFNKMAEKF